MLFEQMKTEDTPILVSYDNGRKQFEICRNIKEEKRISIGFKFIIKSLMVLLLYLVDSVFIGMKGLVR